MKRTLALHAALVLGASIFTLHCDAGKSSNNTSSATQNQGGGGQGGSSPAASSGSTGSAGAGGAVDPCVGRLLCDDFEDDPLGAVPNAPWKTATNQGSVVVDGAHTRSGQKAIKVKTLSGQYKQAFFYVEGAPVFPAPGNVIHGRMMIYMDKTANDGVHWTMIQGSGPLSGHAGVTSHYRYGGMWAGKMMANYETSGLATDCWNNTDEVMPTGRFTCMEWSFDGPANGMRFWLDGVEVSALAVTNQGMGCVNHDLADQWLSPTFDRMSLGWESYQVDDAREAWIDDVILDDEPIGCP